MGKDNQRMCRIVLLTLLSMCQTSAAFAQDMQPKTLYHYIPRVESWGELTKKQETWLLNLTAIAKESTEFQRVKQLLKDQKVTDESKVIFDVTTDGQINNMEWIRKASSSSLSSAISTIIQKLSPLKDVPRLIAEKHSVSFTFKANDDLDLQVSWAPKRVKD